MRFLGTADRDVPVEAWLNQAVERLGWFALLMAYWLFTRQLERIDLVAAPSSFLASILAPLSILPPPVFRLITFGLEMFSPRVLRHLIPVVVGTWLARHVIVGLVQTFYGLPSAAAAGTFFGRLQRRAGSGGLGKAVRVARESWREDAEKYPVLRIGGPGKIGVGEHDVVVTEKNGRFARVLGPGTHVLEKFEYIRSVLDLRQQEREAQQIPLVTSDGIEVRVDVGVIFRLQMQRGTPVAGPAPVNGAPAGDESPPPAGESVPDPADPRQVPYPFVESAVQRAAYAETVLPGGEVATWESLPLQTVIDTLQRLVGELRLDELIFPEMANPRRAEYRPHQILRQRTFSQAAATLNNAGIELLTVRLGRLDTDQPIVDQRIRYWQAYWDRQAMVAAADGEAKALTEVALARAEAEAVMMRAIVEGLEPARYSGGAQATREIVALRLVESLERIARQSLADSPEVDQVLQRLEAWQYQLRTQDDDPVSGGGERLET